MTRLELLLNTYTPAQKRDTWIALGQMQVDIWTKVYTENSVFRLQASGVPLTGAIFFCDEDFTDLTFDWSKWTINDLSSGTIINTDGIIHPHLYIILTQSQFQDLNSVDFNPNWIPFQELGVDDAVIINEQDLHLILKDVGVPFISIDELEYNRATILRLMVLPAVLEYFKWHPIITVQTYPVAAFQKFEIPIPNYAFTAQRAYILPGYTAAGLTNAPGNPLSFYLNELSYSINPMGAYSPNMGSGRRRARFQETDALTSYLLERAVRKGASNIASRIRIKIQHVNKKITGYSTLSGLLEVEWASYSNKWDDIPFNRQSEVRELATAYVLRNIGLLRSQASPGIPGLVDYQKFLDRADKLEEKIIKLWQETTKAVVIRSS